MKINLDHKFITKATNVTIDFHLKMPNLIRYIRYQDQELFNHILMKIYSHPLFHLSTKEGGGVNQAIDVQSA